MSCGRSPCIWVGRSFEHAGLKKVAVDLSFTTLDGEAPLRLVSYGMFVSPDEVQAQFEDRRRRILADIDQLAGELWRCRQEIAEMSYPGIPENGAVRAPAEQDERQHHG
jgi:hypothetical protein